MYRLEKVLFLMGKISESQFFIPFLHRTCFSVHSGVSFVKNNKILTEILTHKHYLSKCETALINDGKWPMERVLENWWFLEALLVSSIKKLLQKAKFLEFWYCSTLLNISDRNSLNAEYGYHGYQGMKKLKQEYNFCQNFCPCSHILIKILPCWRNLDKNFKLLH